jgi:1-phosphatidylinositol-3-phosphate 5-kinase
MRIRVRPETQLRLKNTDYERLMNRTFSVVCGASTRSDSDQDGCSNGDEETDAKLTSELNQLIIRAESERAEVVGTVNEIYRDSPSTDTLALNQVRSYLQDKIVAWQVDFDKLPKPKGGRSDKSSRRTSTFGTVRQSGPGGSIFPEHLSTQSLRLAFQRQKRLNPPPYGD